jgi:microcystin-dependent protein
MGTDTYLGAVGMFAGNFAVRGWAFCDGQMLAISQNTALFAILGTTYGGDGRTTFAVPDLRGRMALHPGNGPGLSSYRLGQRGGQETVTLDSSQIPSHTHIATGKLVTTAAPAGNSPDSNLPGTISGRTTPGNESVNISGWGPTAGSGFGAENGVNVAVNNTGGGLSHNNIQPFLCINYEIALVGIFPSRT